MADSATTEPVRPVDVTSWLLDLSGRLARFKDVPADEIAAFLHEVDELVAESDDMVTLTAEQVWASPGDDR